MPDPIVFVTPNALTLNSGESAQVTVTVDAASPSGVGSVTIPVTVPSLYDHIWEGPSAIVVPAGEHHLARGLVDYTADAHVRGLLELDPFATLDGHNQFETHTHDGGRVNWQGIEKTAWLLWGDAPIGWEIGDRLAVAPNVPDVYAMAFTTWQGSWAATARPANSPDFTLRDGRVMRPEVVNCSQTLTIKNMTRIMFHHSDVPAAQTLKWLRVLDSGIPSVPSDPASAGFYPIHFHLNGEASRGSLLEGVVVEGGKQYAFVPHGSHGITFIDCAGVNTRNGPFWWDAPGTAFYVGGGLDPSDDIIYNHCLALGITASQGTISGFRLAEGLRCKALGCHAAAFPTPGADGSGAHWRFGTDPWEFSDFVAHNIAWDGIHVWDNSGEVHLVERIVAYNCGYVENNGKFYGGEFDHGAYGNLYHYRDIYGDLFRLHAKSEAPLPGAATTYLTIERANLEVLEVVKHQLGRFREAKVIDSTIGLVRYNEPAVGKGSWIQYEDCGLNPADFQLVSVATQTVIEVFEAGVLQHRWASGGWS